MTMNEDELVAFDEDKLDEVVLALLHLNSFKDNYSVRAWKSLDWDSLNRLHDRDLVADPKSKAKSIALTQEGERLAGEMFRKHFGKTA